MSHPEVLPDRATCTAFDGDGEPGTHLCVHLPEHDGAHRCSGGHEWQPAPAHKDVPAGVIATHVQHGAFPPGWTRTGPLPDPWDDPAYAEIEHNPQPDSGVIIAPLGESPEHCPKCRDAYKAERRRRREDT